jgi:DNA-binding NarL/FixJ family response regulator
VAEKVRILMIDVQGEIHDLLQALVAHRDDMEMVGEASDPIDLLLAVNDTQSDVVILEYSQPDRIPGICTHLLAEYPDLLIFVLSTRDHRCFLYERNITQEEIPYQNPEDLIMRIDEAFSSPAH